MTIMMMMIQAQNEDATISARQRTYYHPSPKNHVAQGIHVDHHDYIQVDTVLVRTTAT
jgi:hypothetical protein